MISAVAEVIGDTQTSIYRNTVVAALSHSYPVVYRHFFDLYVSPSVDIGTHKHSLFSLANYGTSVGKGEKTERECKWVRKESYQNINRFRVPRTCCLITVRPTATSPSPASAPYEDSLHDPPPENRDTSFVHPWPQQTSDESRTSKETCSAQQLETILNEPSERGKTLMIQGQVSSRE